MNAQRITQWVLFILVLAANSRGAVAGDAALYGPVAPANAGFFRVINLDPAQRLTVRNESGKTMAELPSGQASPYAFLAEGAHHLMLNDKPWDLTLHRGEQTSLIWQAGVVSAIAEQPFKDKSKARIVLYNLTKSPLDLTTQDGKPIVTQVVSGQQNGRDVNAVKIPLGVARSGTVLTVTAPLSLQRGQVTSLFAIDRGSLALLVFNANR
jgi:alginate O-acetyltransferase complex protein AlgF